MNTELCPDRNTLQKLLMGDLPADQRESLGEHLMNCGKCAATAETLTLSDELTAAICARRVIEEDDETLAEVIERGKQLCSEIDTVESEATLVVDQRSENEARDEPSPDTKNDTVSEEDYDFLHPPQEPDEIGRLGGYRVLEVMGIGGMGVVFRAEDPQLERIVALKAMIPVVFGNRSAKERFLKEARATASLEHDNIVQIYQVGEDRDVPFIAMQFLRGESLKSRLQREKQLPQHEVVRIGREVAAGLAAAHQRNLIHRDIKPENIWLEAGSGRVRILDFGLVRNVSEDGGITQSGIVLGTPRYMSPEQAQGQELDYRCDLFSLGSVLYHLVTGTAPFDGANLTSTLMAVAHTDPAPVGRVAPQLHPGLSKLITQLLAKDRERRPRSAADVVTALTAIERDLEAGYVAGGNETQENTVIAQPLPAGDTVLEGEPVPFIKTAGDRDGRPPRRKTGLWMWGSFAVILLLGVITFATAKGTVTINVPQEMKDEVKVNVYGEHDVVEVLEKHNNWSVKLASGEYTLQVKGGNEEFRLVENTIEVTRFGRRVVRLRYEPKAAVVDSPPSTDGFWQKRLPAGAPAPAIAPFTAEKAKQHQEAWAKYLGIPVEYENSIGMKFRLIPPGEFLMGSTPEEIEAALEVTGENQVLREEVRREAPQHKVVLTQPLYVGVTEVTQAQYEQVMGTNPSHFAATGEEREEVANLETGNHPVETVSWNDAAEFCAKLSQQEQLKPFYLRAGETVTPLEGNGYRLPTEAEWEYACRAGTTTRFWSGDDDNDLDSVAWFADNSGVRTHTVGELRSNPFGLSDVHGNVWEWVQDSWEPAFYGKFTEKAAVDPVSPFSNGSRRVLRGGIFHGNPSRCRSSDRHAATPQYLSHDKGFRVVLVVDAVKERPNAPRNFALSFDGKDDSVEIPNPPEWRNGPLTLEATVHSELVGEELPAVLDLVGFKVRMNRPGFQWMFIAFGHAEQSVLIGEPYMPLQQKLKELKRDQQIAAVYDRRSISLFINGQLRVRAPVPDDFTIRTDSETGYIGNSFVTAEKSFFAGTIDEVRISNIARYTEDYIPEGRFEDDEHTLALYHFEEGQGDVLKDSSGNGRDGKIQGATWVGLDVEFKVADEPPERAGVSNRTESKTEVPVTPKTAVEHFLALGGKVGVIVDGRFQWISDADLPKEFVVQSVRLSGSNAVKTPDDLKPLLILPELEEVWLNSDSVTNDSMQYLAGLKNLKSLSLEGAKIDGTGLKSLSKLNSIQYLRLNKTLVSDDSLESLSGLNRLVNLDLTGTSISDSGLRIVARLHRLEFLSLGQTNVTLDGILSLKNLKQLKALWLSDLPVDDSGLRSILDSFGTLESLSLEKTKITDDGLKDFSGREWSRIILDETNITDAGILNLIGAKSLQILEVRGCHVSNKSLDKIAERFPGVQVFRQK